MASLELDAERIWSNVTDQYQSGNDSSVARSQAADELRAAAIQLEGIVTSARDIMRKDAGLSSDLDRVPQLAWLLFLKLFDAIERVIHASRQKCRPITAEMVVANVSMGRR